jgi:ABC-type Fe3+-siderophore transport system permease subunit
MRRILAITLGVASVPVGVALGVWIAQLTRLPNCPVRGLGTAALCVGQPLFAQGLCALCGAAATAVLLLASIGARRPASPVAKFDLVAAEVGVLVGIWTSTFIYVVPPCGPHELCAAFLAQRFTFWESALVGTAAMAVILVIGAAASPELRRANVSSVRTVRDWLFNDLSKLASGNR